MTYSVESTGQPTATVFGLVVGIGGATGTILGSSVLGAIKQAGLSYQQSLLTLELPFALLVLIFLSVIMTSRAKKLSAATKPADIGPETPVG